MDRQPADACGVLHGDLTFDPTCARRVSPQRDRLDGRRQHTADCADQAPDLVERGDEPSCRISHARDEQVAECMTGEVTRREDPPAR